jgi:hypothetical protein
MSHITAKTIRQMLLTGLALTAVVLLGGLQGAQAGVDVWTTTGPEGGTVQALAIDPQTPTTLYLRAGRGVHKSTDGGGRWTTVNTGLPSSYLSAQNLVIDPQTPTTLYAGTFGEGVFQSTDGGGTWTAVNTGLSTYPPGTGSYPNVQALAIDPQTPITPYLGLGGGHGIYKSTDGAGSWSLASTGLGGGPIDSLAIDPQTPTTLYAATGSGGIFKSTDAGGTWRAASAGLPQWSYGYVAVSSVVIDPQTPAILYAATGAGVFKSIVDDITYTTAP